MRRIVVLLSVLVVLLVIADRVVVVAAQRLVAQRIESDQGLDRRPDVTIGGFPFLTQAISGTYDDVTLRLDDVHRGGVAVASVVVHVSGVHVSLGAVFSRHLSSVPIDHARATVLLSYADIDTFLAASHVRVAYAGGAEVRVSGSATVAGRLVTLSGVAGVEVSGDALLLRPPGEPAVTIPLGQLPFGIRLESARATKQGITVTASANGLVVRP